VTIPLEGVQWIEASAGTGKTWTLADLYLRLLLEKELPPQRILVVTYTRAATAELRQRLRDRVAACRDALAAGAAPGAPDLEELAADARERGSVEAWRSRLDRALHAFDEAAVFTVHGFCQRVLEDLAFESGADFERELLPDATALVDDLARDFWAAELHDAPPALLAQLARDHLGPESLASLAHFLLANPDARVLPHEVPEVDVERRAPAFAHALDRARSLWSESADEIVDLLCEHPGLHRGSYNALRIRTHWRAELDDGLASDRPGVAERISFLGRIATGGFRLRRGEVAPEHPFFDACAALAEADAAWSADLQHARLALEQRFARSLSARLDARKQEQGHFTYDDLLTRLRAALRGPLADGLVAALREQYAAVLVDEFQDTDPLQWEIFQRAWGPGSGRSLFLIGDPKQAIYGFRGADVYAYLAAGQAVPAAARHGLRRNWRSSPGLIRGLNALFGGVERPFGDDAIDYVAVEPSPKAPADDLGRAPLRFLLAAAPDVDGKSRKIPAGRAERQLPAAVAADIARWLAAPPDGGVAVTPRDFAVLCRTNVQARAVQEALREVGVPSVLHSDASVFDSTEAAWLERLLRALVTPGDARAVRAALATPLLGVDAAGLLALAADEPGWDAWLVRFRRWSAVFRRDGVVPALRAVQQECGSTERLVRQVGGERSLTNLRHLSELLQAEAARGHHGPGSLVRWLVQLRRDAAARTAVEEDTQLRLESDARAVQLVTIHKSKGLEYEIVYCPFAWKAADLFPEERRRPRWHDTAAGPRLCIDLGSDDHETHRDLAREESLAEASRLLYVALTRARRHCSVIWGRFEGADRSALAGLLHPEGLDGLDDEGVREALERMVERAPGAVAVEPLGPTEAPRYLAAAAPPAALSARVLERPPHVRWRGSSFSALTQGEGAARGPGAEGHDYDAFDAGPEPGAPPPPSRRVVLADFPAGARPGTLLHELLETRPFDGLADRSEDRALELALRRHGVASSWVPAVSEALAGVLAAELPDPAGGAPFRLGGIPPERRQAELEFALPVVEPGLTAPALAKVFAAADPPVVRRYAEAAERLGFGALAGSLRGFVDLVFEHEGRYYLLDYKSNHLGEDRASYGAIALADAMIEHHYVLQYHLYWVALHRYLLLRLPDFDYERHMGGVLYLFLRGMAPGDGHGVYTDRPVRALSEALSATLRGVTSGAGP